MIKNCKGKWVAEPKEVHAEVNAAKEKMAFEIQSPIPGMNEAETKLHWFGSGFYAALRWVADGRPDK